MSYDFMFKYIMIGDMAVGKSCLLLRFTEGEFREGYEMTVGAEFGGKIVNVEAAQLYLQIWDTAGQENFRSLTRTYYRGAAVALIVYDITRRQTFENVKEWIAEVYSNGNLNTVIALVGNKTDLEQSREVTTREAEAFAKAKGLLYVEASAKDGLNVAEIFEAPARELYRRLQTNEVDMDTFRHGIKAGLKPPSEQNRSRCCWH